jgi:hypothetical protein
MERLAAIRGTVGGHFPAKARFCQGLRLARRHASASALQRGIAKITAFFR